MSLDEDSKLKLSFDFFKHLTTLNVAGIGLLFGLADRMFANGLEKQDLFAVLLGFGLSLTLAWLIMGHQILYETKDDKFQYYVRVTLGFLSVFFFLMTVYDFAECCGVAFATVRLPVPLPR